MFEFLSNVEIRKYSIFWWCIVILVIAAIGLICFNLFNRYYAPKPEEIVHYEGMRDNLSNPEIAVNESLNSTVNPCCLDKNSTKVNGAVGNLWRIGEIICVVGFIFVLLSVFRIESGSNESRRNKKGMSLIGGIVSLTVIAIVFAQVLLPTLQSVCVCP